MDARLCAALVILGAGLCHAACEVSQRPAIVAAFFNDSIKIECQIFQSSEAGVQEVTSEVVRSGGIGVALGRRTLRGNATVTHDITTRESGYYLCSPSCGARSQKGTYVYVRESGYAEPAHVPDRVRCGLIVLCALLALLACVASYLLLSLFWRRQEKPPTLTRGGGASTRTAHPRPGSQHPAEETSGSVYTSLQSHSDELYHVLEEAPPPRHSSLSHEAEIHQPAGANAAKRPKPQVKPPPVKEKPQKIPGKPPVKKKPKKAVSDSDVYENLKH